MKVKVLLTAAILTALSLSVGAEEYKINYSNKIVYINGNIENRDINSVTISIRNDDDVKYAYEIPVDEKGEYTLKFKYNGPMLGTDYKLYVQNGEQELSKTVNTAQVTSSGIEAAEFKISNIMGNNQVGLNDALGLSAKILNKNSEDKNLKGAVAIYDKDNRLISCSTLDMPVSFFDYCSQKDLISDIKLTENADTVKVFLFDDFEQMIPLANSVSQDSIITASMFDVVNPYKVAFVGDSLTFQQGYYNYIEHFYTTRYPNNQITFVNKGVPGDTTAELRYSFDVVNDPFSQKPDEIVYNMGINFFLWIYDKFEPGSGDLNWWKEVALKDWEKGVNSYITNTKSDNIKLTLAQSEFFDDDYYTVQSLGVNESLNAMSDILRIKAKENNLDYIVTNNELLDISDEIRQNAPELIGNQAMKADGVHDTDGAGAISAAKFVQKQGAQLYVANVYISDDEANAENAEISNVVKNNSYASFTFMPYSIPMAYADGVKDAKERLKYNLEDFNNREIIQVSQLDEGNYNIVFDGVPLEKSYSAQNLAEGVNISIDPKNPDQITAMRVYEKNREKCVTESYLRNMATFEYSLNGDDNNFDVTDDDALLEFVDNELTKISNGEESKYTQERLQVYKTHKLNEAQYWNKIDELNSEIKSLCKPSTSNVEIIKIN